MLPMLPVVPVVQPTRRYALNLVLLHFPTVAGVGYHDFWGSQPHVMLQHAASAGLWDCQPSATSSVGLC